MVDPVGYRFRPTDEEIVGHYVRPKNLESNTSHVDEVMNTVDIYSFDPWELPCKCSRIKSRDEVVWYFFGCKKQMHNNKQRRSTASGFWSKTGDTTQIIRKKGDHEKIGEKRVFVFKYSSKIPGGSKSKSKSKSKSDWVMHEYVATFSSPDSQTMMMMTYTVCKVMFKGDPTDLPSSSAAASVGSGEIEQNHSPITHMNSNSSGGLSTETEVQNPNQTTTVSLIPVNNSSEGLSTEAEVEYRDRGGRSHQITSSISLVPHVNNNNSGGLSTETEVDPRLFSGFLYLEEDARIEDATLRAFNSLPNNDDAEEQEELVNLWSMQEDRNDHRPKMPLTGFISDDDDSDSESLYATTTCSIKSSTTCVSFASSNPPIDQIIYLPESPRSTIESVSLTQEVSEALGANSALSEKKMSPCDDDAQVSEIGGDQMGQEMVIKNKRAGFIYRMIQKFAKKIKLCSCVSRI
uniref:NAC domain-containing protein n=1 Tax=Brassica campestris TaxID=3711 RepID=A0A3P6D1P3_BRACM|nr:unnamed protein product [Brassica rapa]